MYQRQEGAPEDAVCSTVFEAVEALSAPFFCSGSVRLQRPVVISYEGREGSGTKSLQLPGASSEEIEELSRHCSDATFGREEGDWKSLKLDAANFLTSFDLASSGILQALQGVLVPKGTQISAELRRLNLNRPGDFFRPHVETPRQGLFAALVVVLPCKHTGGELLIRHNETLETMVTGDDAGTIIRWAAFFSDCVHEVKQVNSGLRCTLAYGLMSSDVISSLAATIDPSGLAVYQAFARARSMVRNIVLGFPCQHVYPLSQDGGFKTSEELEKLLKGADALVLVVAKCAGLEAEVREVEDPELKSRRIRCAKNKQANPFRPPPNEPNMTESYRPLVILARIR